MGGVVLGGVLVACGYFYFSLLGPREAPLIEVARAEGRPASSTILGLGAPELEPREGAGAEVVPASSTILGVPTPEPEPRKTEIPSKTEAKITLAQIASAEAARQRTPDGPLYDPGSGVVALSFERIRTDDPRVAEAEEVLAKYLQAATWRDRLPFVFEPERVGALMQEWYENRSEKDPQHERLLGAGVITAGASKVLNLRFACTTRLEAGIRANFHRTHAGKLLLDWESWVAWGDESWPDFKRERSPREVVMRAVASESSYYNYEFAESWRWLAVKLRSPDGLHNVTGYVDRKSVLGIAMANVIGVPLPYNLPDGTPLPALKLPGSKALVTVRLTFPNTAQSDHCVMIKGLLADRWLLFAGENR